MGVVISPPQCGRDQVGFITFRVVQTVGVNAAQTTNTIKFPRLTFGFVPPGGRKLIKTKRGGNSREEKKTEK